MSAMQSGKYRSNLGDTFLFKCQNNPNFTPLAISKPCSNYQQALSQDQDQGKQQQVGANSQEDDGREGQEQGGSKWEVWWRVR